MIALRQLFEQLQIIPNEYRHLASLFWAEEEKKNRLRARFVGYSAIVLVVGLGIADLARVEEERRLAIGLINLLLLATNLVIALNERPLLRQLPIYPLFAVAMTVNILGATAIALLSGSIMQLLLVFFVISVALLLVPGVTAWFLLPAIPLAMVYYFVIQTADWPEAITTSNVQIYIITFMAPLLIAVMNRMALQQHWQAFLARHDLQEQKAALEDVNRQLQKRNTELDAFAHTVAHDLKNPLTLVVGYAEILEEEMDEASPWLDYVQQIVLAGRKSHVIIQELLLLAVVRREDIALSPLDMALIVGQALERLSHHIEEDAVVIVQPDSWPTVMGYAGWVEEVWVNYVSNAVKYGGRPCRVELGATCLPNGMVRFWVQDNGDGLSSESQKLLFQEFTRLNKIKARGHGLGLSIVRRIMDKLNGRVGVESTLGEGSRFYFELPIKA